MKTTSRLASLLLAAAFSAGCATLVHGTTETVTIESVPSGASVKVDDVPIGTTPATMDLERGKTHTVLIEKEGYLPRTETIGSGTSWWVGGNILAGGIVGICVDLATGGAYELSPERVYSTLTSCGPKETASAPAAPAAKAPAEPSAVKQ